jgi:hypothetical protein
VKLLIKPWAGSTSSPIFASEHTCASADLAGVGIAQKLLTVCGNPPFRSLLGVKRTCPLALHMSAYDPKRTSARRSTACAGAEVCGRLCVYLVRERFYR